MVSAESALLTFISSSCTTLSPAFWFYSYWLDSLTTMWTFSSFHQTLVWSLMLSILIHVLLLINLWCLRRSFGCDCKWDTRTIICNMACARLKGLKRTKMRRVDYNFIVASLTFKWDIRPFICYKVCMACTRIKGLKRSTLHCDDYNFIVASLALPMHFFLT